MFLAWLHLKYSSASALMARIARRPHSSYASDQILCTSVSSQLLTFMPCLPCLVFTILSFSFIASGFEFSYTPPSSCDALTISWSGGIGPFYLLLTPLFDVPQNISIPDSAFDPQARNGSFLFRLALLSAQQFLLTMSDSTGFESGGTSDLLTVGSSISGSSCNTPPNPDFFFQLSSALQQCRAVTFSGYDNATQPVKIMGLIPLGQSFKLDPPSGPTRFDWIANVSKGTSIIFMMIDAAGRQGGSSDLRVVGITDDDSCIDASSPHSTVQASSTQTGVPIATQTQQAELSSKIGIIAGATVGGMVLFSLAFFASFLCFRDRGTKHLGMGNPDSHVAFVNSGTSRISRVRNSLIPSSIRARRGRSSLDLLPPAAPQTSRDSAPHRSIRDFSGDEVMLSPFILPSEDGAFDGHSAHALSESILSRDLSLRSNFSRARRASLPLPDGVTKGAPAGATRNVPRFVLHADAEDLGSSIGSQEVIELPPQYTDRRESSTKREEDDKLDQVSG